MKVKKCPKCGKPMEVTDIDAYCWDCDLTINFYKEPKRVSSDEW